MMTTVQSRLATMTAAGGGDDAVSVAVKPELMMDYQLTTPYSGATASLAAAPLDGGEVAFYTVTSSGGVAQVAPDPSSDTGWSVTDLSFTAGQATAIAAYQDTDGSTVVFVTSGAGLSSARSTSQWAWAPLDLGQPAVGPLLGVRAQQCSPAQSLPPTVAVAAMNNGNGIVTEFGVYGQPSGQAAYAVDTAYPDQFLDFAPGPVLPAGQAAPQPGAFVNEPGEPDLDLSPGIRCCAAGSATSAFIEGTFAALATTVNSSGWLEAFVIDAMAGNSLNYLSPAGSTFAEVPIAQRPGGGGQQGADYAVGSMAAVTDGLGVLHVLACTTDGLVLHVAQSADAPSGWAPAAPVAELGGTAELTAVADQDGDVHVFARADRSGQVTYLLRSVATGEWTVELVSADVPHQDYVGQIATYSANVSVYQADGCSGCGLEFTLTATDPITAAVDGISVDLGAGLQYGGIVGPDGQVVIVWPTTSLSMPTLYAWFEGMPAGDQIAICMSGPIQATIDAVTTGTELLAIQTATSDKLVYSTGPLLGDLSQPDADTAATAIDAVLGLTSPVWDAADARLHPSSRPHAARYLVGWDGTPADRIDRTECPDQCFRLTFDGSGPLFETLDPAGVAAARAELIEAGSWLPDVSWGDVFAAVSDRLGPVTQVLVSAVGSVIDATISMVVDGVRYVWDAVVSGAGQLLDLVQTIFASLDAGFWALVGWLGWVFNWNDILLTHEAISYFITNGFAWTRYGLTNVAGKLDQAIAGVQADLSEAVAAFLASEVPAGATIASVMAGQPPAPAGTDPSGDPRNVFGRALRTNGNDATVTPGPVQPTPVQDTAAQDLLGQVGQYGADAAASAPVQAFTQLAQPTASNDAGIFGQSMTDVVQTAAEAAAWGLDLVQDGADAMFGLASSAIGGMTSVLTQTWDIPLLTDLYRWVTDGSELTALDVMALLLAVPATITYKAMFGESPIPDIAALDALMAAYPAPPSAEAGAERGAVGGAGSQRDDAAAALDTGARLANILTGLCFIQSGGYEARVDLNIALWNTVTGGEKLTTPRCPASWQGSAWVGQISEIWEILYVISEFEAAMFANVATLVPNATSWDCGEVEGMANWICVVGNFQWFCDYAALLCQETVVQGVWATAGPAILTIWGLVQLGLQIFGWYRLGSKNWPGTVAGLLTSLPNAGKGLISPAAIFMVDGIPVGPLVEAALDVGGNLAGGIFYIMAAALDS